MKIGGKRVPFAEIIEKSMQIGAKGSPEGAASSFKLRTTYRDGALGGKANENRGLKGLGKLFAA